MQPGRFRGIRPGLAETNSVLTFDDEVHIKAYAKINFTLRVLGRRRDGFHDLETLMVRVSCFDSIAISKGTPGLRLHCPKLPEVPPEKNLAYRAALSLLDRVGVTAGLEIYIDKHIPVGAGMGGGSSDAAAVLLGVNYLLGDGAASTEVLHDVARSLGADVPFFVGANGAPPLWAGAVCTGIGDVISPVNVGQVSLVIAVPNFSVSTPWAYSAYDRMTLGTMLTPVESDVQEAARYLSLGDHRRLAKLLHNDLERPVLERFPDIQAIKEGLLRSSALGALMTGSGSAVFAVCRSDAHACQVRDRFLSSYSSLVKELLVARTEGV